MCGVPSVNDTARVGTAEGGGAAKLGFLLPSLSLPLHTINHRNFSIGLIAFVFYLIYKTVCHQKDHFYMRPTT